jgi:segregation and condensation protein B
MEISEIKNILEALLFVSERPITLKEFKNILKEDYSDLENIEDILNELKNDYEVSEKSYELRFVADGWILATKSQYFPWIKKLFKKKFVFKLSPSALETLAIIAYKQPVTRSDIDNIRGIDSSGVLDTLMERKLIKILGRKEALGHPLLYGTTQEFMKHFGLSHLNDLPLIDESNQQDDKDYTDEYTENGEPQLPLEENQNDETNQELTKASNNSPVDENKVDMKNYSQEEPNDNSFSTENITDETNPETSESNNDSDYSVESNDSEERSQNQETGN